MTGVPASVPRGRPRSERVHQAILDTALELAFEVGFRALSVEAIAAKAGVGKTTIYRRWPNKGAVVMEAFLTTVGPRTGFPATERAIDSILLQMRTQVKAFRSKYGKLVRAIVGEGQFDSEVRDTFREKWIMPRRVMARNAIEEAMRQGDLRADIDPEVVIDVLYAPIYYRLQLETAPLSDAYAEALFLSMVQGFGSTAYLKRAEKIQAE